MRCNFRSILIYPSHANAISQEQNSASSQSSPATVFHTSRVKNESQTYLYCRPDGGEKPATYLNFHNSVTYLKLVSVMSEQISTSLASNEDRAISVVITVTKLELNDKKSNLDDGHLSCWTRVNNCHKHEFGFGCLHAEIWASEMSFSDVRVSDRQQKWIAQSSESNIAFRSRVTKAVGLRRCLYVLRFVKKRKLGQYNPDRIENWFDSLMHTFGEYWIVGGRLWSRAVWMRCLSNGFLCGFHIRTCRFSYKLVQLRIHTTP